MHKISKNRIRILSSVFSKDLSYRDDIFIFKCKRYCSMFSGSRIKEKFIVFDFVEHFLYFNDCVIYPNEKKLEEIEIADYFDGFRKYKKRRYDYYLINYLEN